MLASSPVTNNSSPTTGIIIPLNTNTNLTHTPTSGISPLTNPTTTAKFLSKQDREALLQYTKHFTRKAVQIIVQSRLGDKKPTKSRVFAYNADWFNLSIKDLAQITSMTKMSLGNVESLFNANSPFCIEISLRTPENQTMVLETWCISFNDQLVDPTQKVCYNVYKKMSLVLRSLMCITRSTPTYQLSRRQSSDSYVLLYRMYCGEPIVHHLGENYATSKVGTVGTPIGSIVLNLAYRTRLTMTPQTSSHLNEYPGGIQIKDDHFDSRSGRQQTESPLTFNPNSRYSSSDLINNNSPSSPPIIDNRSPRGGSFGASGGGLIINSILEQQHNQSSSQSSLSKRSSSNLNTIVESPYNDKLSRQSSKAQPIPMRQQQQLQLQRYSNEFAANQQQQQMHHANDESSNDEYNSSSVASTPDTIYYFKLKSAAFVPSASFTNNYYSTSIGNVSNNEPNIDLPPFITLLSTDFSNLTTNERNTSQPHQIAQSPPPPQTLIEYNTSQLANRTVNTKQLKHRSYSTNDDHMSSPCSLPNFKMLDNYNQHFLNNYNQNNFSNNNNNSNNLHQPDDFVFIDSKKIAFGLSNAADDLSTFFRACENAPILDSFQNEPNLNEVFKDLDQQLLVYESKVSEFDELIKTLETN